MTRETVIATIKARAHMAKHCPVRKPDIVRISSWGTLYCETRTQSLQTGPHEYIEVAFLREPTQFEHDITQVEW